MRHYTRVNEGESFTIDDRVLQTTIDVVVLSVSGTRMKRGVELKISERPSGESVPSSVASFNLSSNKPSFKLEWNLEVGRNDNYRIARGGIQSHPSNGIRLYVDYDPERYIMGNVRSI